MIKEVFRTFWIWFGLISSGALAQPLDYTPLSNWYAHPDLADVADKLPQNYTEAQEDSLQKGDVFFIHTTTLLNYPGSNDRLKTPSTKRMARTLIMSQSSAFGYCYRIWAPKYRQVSLHRLKHPGKKTDKALDKAYLDIEAAFLHFISETRDRPFVIAAHGQGSYMAWRLLKEIVDSNPSIRKRMVYASLAGFPMTLHEIGQLDSIKYCHDPNETGCMLNWQTIGKHGYKEPVSRMRKTWGFKNVSADSTIWLCINPITWKSDHLVSSPELHLGSAKTIHNNKDYKIVMTGHIEAGISEGFVQINKPKATLFNSTGRNYHMYDYQLFYLNIKDNSCERLYHWFKSE